MWIDEIVDKVISRNKKNIVLTTSISPTGPLHIGKLRDISMVYFVKKELEQRGYKLTSKLYWDDFDDFHKGANMDEFSKQIGIPLYKVKMANGNNYSQLYKNIFLQELSSLGIYFDKLVDQSELYTKGQYDYYLKKILKEENDFVEIYNTFKSSQIQTLETRTYCPRCFRLTNKSSVHNECYCEHCARAFRRCEGITKLPFNIEWAARWANDESDFEPIGRDHAVPNGVYEQSKEISKRIFNNLPPEVYTYEFVGISRQRKLSVSSGDASNYSISALLSYLPRELILWNFYKLNPKRYMEIDLENKFDYLKLFKEYFNMGNQESKKSKEKRVFERFENVVNSTLRKEKKGEISELFNFLEFSYKGKPNGERIDLLFDGKIQNKELIKLFSNWIETHKKYTYLQSDFKSKREGEFVKSVANVLKENLLTEDLKFHLQNIEEYVNHLDKEDIRAVKIIFFGTYKVPSLHKMLFIFEEEILKELAEI